MVDTRSSLDILQALTLSKARACPRDVLLDPAEFDYAPGPACQCAELDSTKWTKPKTVVDSTSWFGLETREFRNDDYEPRDCTYTWVYEFTVQARLMKGLCVHGKRKGPFERR